MKHVTFLVLLAMLVILLFLLGILPALVSKADSTDNYGNFNQEVVQITTSTTGGLGEATGSGSTAVPVRGHIYAIHLDLAVGLPVDTDITLTGASPTLTILTLTNNITDSWYYPVAVQTGNTGSALTAYDRLPINSKVTVAMAQTYPLTGVNSLTMTVLWGD